MKRITATLVALGFLLAACGSQGSNNTEVLVSVFETTNERVYFPSQAPVEEFGGDGAILGGNLILEAGCLRIDDGHYAYLVIWPPGYSLEINSSPPSVIDENEDIGAAIGNYVEIGGGEASGADFQQRHPALAETNCGGPYWVASSPLVGAEPAPITPEIIFTPYDLGDGDSTYMATQPDTGEPQDVMEALLIGTVVIKGACLHLEDIQSNTLHLPIWPPNYSLEVEEDPIAIVDENGEIRVRVGDVVHLSGGEIGNSEESDLPMVEQLCGGIFWAVGDEVRLYEETP